MQLLDAWSFFALCPSCRREGEPEAARSDGQHTTVTYRCGACQRAWDVTGTQPQQLANSDALPHLPPSPSSDAKE